MKLYEIPDGSQIRLLEDSPGPPGEPVYPKGTEMKFYSLDGMYATCFKDGVRAYPHCGTEVEIIERHYK